MPFQLPENVQETSTTTGTGPLTLAGAVSGRYAFSSQLSNGDTTFYTLGDGVDIEVGIGTYSNTSGQNLSRDSVIYSTNGNALVNWASGTRNVFIGLPGSVVASLLDPTAGNGLVAQTADRIYARRTITAGFGMSVTNGDGVSGNPTIAQTVVPAGTVMLFMQAAAPTGWTQVNTHNNKALRIVAGTGGGSGGSESFTTIFNSVATKTTNAHTLSSSQMPAHTHGVGTYEIGYAGAHTHTFPLQGGGTLPGIVPTASTSGSNQNFTPPNMTNANGSHTHTIFGSSGSAGSGGGHTHTLTLDLQYVDIIACTKDI